MFCLSHSCHFINMIHNIYLLTKLKPKLDLWQIRNNGYITGPPWCIQIDLNRQVARKASLLFHFPLLHHPFVLSESGSGFPLLHLLELFQDDPFVDHGFCKRCKTYVEIMWTLLNVILPIYIMVFFKKTQINSQNTKINNSGH